MKVYAIALAVGLVTFAPLRAQEVEQPETPQPEQPEQPERPQRPDVSVEAHSGAVLDAVASFRERRNELLAARAEIVVQMKGASVESRAALRADLKANREAFRQAKEEFRSEIKEATSKLREHERKVSVEARVE